MINYKFSLENTFKQILYRTDNYINERSGGIVELIESQHINISTYRPLSESFYVKLPLELRSQKKKKNSNQHQKKRSKMFSMVSC